jgi:hypothetical protein
VAIAIAACNTSVCTTLDNASSSISIVAVQVLLAVINSTHSSRDLRTIYISSGCSTRAVVYTQQGQWSVTIAQSFFIMTAVMKSCATLQRAKRNAQISFDTILQSSYICVVTVCAMLCVILLR